ncbi:expressed unknown protein [Seminavis robusta]|uniref:Uncharacterized protein n=1 Tax=Seminavis robusta TaxID=568900 RepID=A0A9N8HS55_9STRA|nr:expressed unknown protein [Seminavis robusta]|eukprot:Sro1135_g245090.1 n/a (191) ;mRNA; r:28133-28705
MDSSSRRHGMDKSLREEYDEEAAENKKLRNQRDEAQKVYLEMADERLEAQSAMFAVLDIIGKSEWRKKQPTDKLVDDAYKLSEECQARARTQMDKLEQATERDMRITKAENDEGMNDMSAASQLEDTTNQFIRQNKQFIRDIKNRQDYLAGETKTKEDFVNATKKVIATLKKECDDKDLIAKVEKAAMLS